MINKSVVKGLMTMWWMDSNRVRSKGQTSPLSGNKPNLMILSEIIATRKNNFMRLKSQSKDSKKWIPLWKKKNDIWFGSLWQNEKKQNGYLSIKLDLLKPNLSASNVLFFLSSLLILKVIEWESIPILIESM